jgi:transcriptional regulator with XRE-family HTH domain/integrase
MDFSRYEMPNEAVISSRTLPMNASIQHSTELSKESTSCSTDQLHARLTYKEFEHHIRKLLAADAWSGQRIANIVSALHGWMRSLKRDAGDMIGAELGSRFAQSFRRYEDEIASTLAARTQKDRQEQIQKLKQLYDALSINDLLPPVFGDALSYAIDRSGETLAQIGRLSGILPQVLGQWCHGKGTPQHETSYARIAGLESALGLPADCLANRLPPRRRARYERQRSEVLESPKAKHATKNICPLLRPTARLMYQWEELIRFKTDVTRQGATAHNSWRLKSVESSGFRIGWAHMCDGAVCATAGVHWAIFAPFLGFITTHPIRGCTVPAEHADTLAWLTSTAHIKSYVQFLRTRAGNVTHHGVVTLLNNARSHLRPETGFLWLHPELVDDLCAAGNARALTIATQLNREAAWRSYCEEAHRELLALEKSLAAHSPVRCVRSPGRRVETILGDAFPLKRLVKLVRDLEADEPPQSHERDYAAWIRDVLFLKMLISNPLRVAQFSVMRFRGSRPNLYQTADGTWRIRFDPSDFKNEKGAAFEEYDSAVEPSVSPWIRRYLSEARPRLIGAETDYLLLPGVEGPDRGAGYAALDIVPAGNWVADTLAKRVFVVTARYMPEGNGFGPHAFRHIIATDHLKRHPQDYITVAQLLHDKLSTVIKTYSHLKIDDGLRTLHSGVALAMRELDEPRR